MIPKTFIDREHYLNCILIVKLLLVSKHCVMKTSGIAQLNFFYFSRLILKNFSCKLPKTAVDGTGLAGGFETFFGIYISCIPKYYTNAYFLFLNLFPNLFQCPNYVYNFPDFISTPVIPPPTPPCTFMSTSFVHSLCILQVKQTDEFSAACSYLINNHKFSSSFKCFFV